MTRLVLFILLSVVTAFAGSVIDLEKDVALSRANQKFRQLAAEALEKEHLEQLVQIERAAAAFADSVGYSKDLFHNEEVILVRFLEKDYAFLADVDSMSKYDYAYDAYDHFADALKNYFRKQQALGGLEKAFEQIENASDRAYARIVIAHCLNVQRSELSKMIEKNVDDLTNEKQLRNLVQKYWHKEGYDLENNICAAIGVSYNALFGDVSERLSDAWGVTSEVDLVFRNIVFGLRLAIEMNEYTGEGNYAYSGGGLSFNVGATTFHTDRLFLRFYGGIGLDISELKRTEDDRDDVAYPSFEAGVIMDTFFYKSTNRIGIRLQSGIKTMATGARDISAGVNFYTALQFVFLETKYKKFEFKYPETLSKSAP